jgi:hypothetical protein
MSVTTGTFPGVRIVDMPDLGVVSDTSSVVGERAGSGRFSAPALRNYVAGYLGTNVRDYGAKGDGIADDTAAIQAAINAVRAGGGTVEFNAGVYMTSATLELPTWVILRGKGVGITIIRAKASTGFDLIATTGFGSLTGSGSCAGTYQNGVFAMTLDGNKDAGRTSGNCLAMYGYDYRIEDVECCNAPNAGFYSEWGTDATVPVAAGANSMEAHISRFKTFANSGDGFVFKGPHDSVLTDVTSFLNGQRGMLFDQSLPTYSGNCYLTHTHSYGNQSTAIQVNASLWVDMVTAENSRSIGGLGVTANGNITGSNVIAYQNTGFGVQVAGSGSTISNLFSYGNSGDGLDISGVENFISTISSTHNTGAGVALANTAQRTVLSDVSVDNNNGLGVYLAGADSSVTGLLAIFNNGGGVGLINGISGVRLSGEINNNGTGVQFAFNTPAGALQADLLIVTVAGQTAWTGTPPLESFMRIATTGASLMPLDVVPHIDAMAAGSVGEFITASVTEGAALPTTSGVPLNVVAVTLQPGDWDVFGNVGFVYSTTGAGANAWVSTVSATQPVNGSLGFAAVGAILGNDALIPTGTARIYVTAPTIVYLGASSGFGSGTGKVFGTIGARRVR